ncbi:MAG: hypothetical protein MI748_21425 [Opitutales bacterium]|nr:hypothetical protein [Opitutales bacterium]
MSGTEKNTPNPLKPVSDKKVGFFKRIVSKLDDSMKLKAEEKAQNSCCGGKDGKGGKCC